MERSDTPWSTTWPGNAIAGSCPSTSPLDPQMPVFSAIHGLDSSIPTCWAHSCRIRVRPIFHPGLLVDPLEFTRCGPHVTRRHLIARIRGAKPIRGRPVVFVYTLGRLLHTACYSSTAISRPVREATGEKTMRLRLQKAVCEHPGTLLLEHYKQLLSARTSHHRCFAFRVGLGRDPAFRRTSD